MTNLEIAAEGIRKIETMFPSFFSDEVELSQYVYINTNEQLSLKPKRNYMELPVSIRQTIEEMFLVEYGEDEELF